MKNIVSKVFLTPHKNGSGVVTGVGISALSWGIHHITTTGYYHVKAVRSIEHSETADSCAVKQMPLGALLNL